jgi:hypothetical protein
VGFEALTLTGAIFGFLKICSLIKVTSVSEQPAASTFRIDNPEEARTKQSTKQHVPEKNHENF